MEIRNETSAWENFEYVVSEFGFLPDQAFWNAVLNKNLAYAESMDQSTYHLLKEQCDSLSGSEYETCLCEASPYWAWLHDQVECHEYRILYWYHPDYLGHNELITDGAGEPYQYFHYSAWGETFVQDDANYGSFTSSYRFNAKELDMETGNYYYGARYYDPQVSVWLSVDPLARKYLTLTPFSFSGNNPVLMADPDGRSPHLLVGFLIGAGVDIAAQMIFDGKGIADLDITSILISGGAGMASGGLSTMCKLGRFGKPIASVAIDVLESAGNQLNEKGEVTVIATAVDLLSGELAKKVDLVDNNRINVYENQLDRANRVGKDSQIDKATKKLNSANWTNDAGEKITGTALDESAGNPITSFLLDLPVTDPSLIIRNSLIIEVQDQTQISIPINPELIER